MTDETIAAEQAGAGNRHLSRRTVLRAAGHAAWVVPAIQVVSMAPAFADASDVLEFFPPIPTGGWTKSGNGANRVNYMDATVTVRNTSTTDDAVAVLLTVNFPNLYVWQPGAGGGDSILSVDVQSGAWDVYGDVEYFETGTNRTATAYFMANDPVDKNMGTSELQFRATTTRRVGKGNAGSGGSADTVDVQASAFGFGSDSTSFNPSPWV